MYSPPLRPRCAGQNLQRISSGTGLRWRSGLPTSTASTIHSAISSVSTSARAYFSTSWLRRHALRRLLHRRTAFPLRRRQLFSQPGDLRLKRSAQLRELCSRDSAVHAVLIQRFAAGALAYQRLLQPGGAQRQLFLPVCRGLRRTQMPRQIFPVQIPRHAGLQRLQHTLRGLVPPDAHTRAALRGHSVGAAPQVFSRTAVFALQLSAAQRAAAFSRQRRSRLPSLRWLRSPLPPASAERPPMFPCR